MLASLLFVSASVEAREPSIIKGSYIVVFNNNIQNSEAEVNNLETEVGFRASNVYDRSIDGFAARLDSSDIRELKQTGDIASISPNLRFKVNAVKVQTGERAPEPGMRRIGISSFDNVAEYGAPVAVIDTGIDLNHPDLNAAHGKTCAGSGMATDVYGHGTHVAGIIGAKNNGVGTTGVAPGTPLYSVRVLDENGVGSSATLICGIDWVAKNASRLGIKVINMSLGGLGNPIDGTCNTTGDPERLAVCRAVAAGVSVVAAAGNDGVDFDCFYCDPSMGDALPDIPAAFPEVLTVTAMGDSDGRGSRYGNNMECSDATEFDDQTASFSNFAGGPEARAHTIAAPGVCVRSTVPGGKYASYSGTSMASPHVAGLVALCYMEAGVSGPCTGKSPAEVIQYMRSQAEGASNSNTERAFRGDPSNPWRSTRYFGYLAASTGNKHLTTQSPIPAIENQAYDAPVQVPDTKLYKFTLNKKTKKAVAYARGTANTTSLQCSLDGAMWKTCPGKNTIKNLKKGTHILRVRAVAPRGLVDKTPAEKAFTI